jgi:hypothetical protein
VENRGSLHPLYAIAGKAVRAFGWKTGSTTGTPPSARIVARENRGAAERCCASIRVATSRLRDP